MSIVSIAQMTLSTVILYHQLKGNKNKYRDPYEFLETWVFKEWREQVRYIPQQSCTFFAWIEQHILCHWRGLKEYAKTAIFARSS